MTDALDLMRANRERPKVSRDLSLTGQPKASKQPSPKADITPLTKGPRRNVQLLDDIDSEIQDILKDNKITLETLIEGLWLNTGDKSQVIQTAIDQRRKRVRAGNIARANTLLKHSAES